MNILYKIGWIERQSIPKFIPLRLMSTLCILIWTTCFSPLCLYSGVMRPWQVGNCELIMHETWFFFLLFLKNFYHLVANIMTVLQFLAVQLAGLGWRTAASSTSTPHVLFQMQRYGRLSNNSCGVLQNHPSITIHHSTLSKSPHIILGSGSTLCIHSLYSGLLRLSVCATMYMKWHLKPFQKGGPLIICQFFVS